MIRTTELLLHSPDIHSLADAVQAKESLSLSPGIDEVEIDHQTGEVRVVTSNQDQGLDVRTRLIQAGFPPDRVEQRTIGAPLTS